MWDQQGTTDLTETKIQLAKSLCQGTNDLIEPEVKLAEACAKIYYRP